MNKTISALLITALSAGAFVANAPVSLAAHRGMARAKATKAVTVAGKSKKQKQNPPAPALKPVKAKKGKMGQKGKKTPIRFVPRGKGKKVSHVRRTHRRVRKPILPPVISG